MKTHTIITLALAILVTQGEAAVQRALTPPENWVRSICKKTGADPELALEERNEAAKAWVAFIEALADIPDDQVGDQVAEDLGIIGRQKATKLPQLNTSLIELGVLVYRAFGRDALQRALTVPRSAVKAICDKTGADFQEVLAAREAATEELVEFVESLADRNFEDPE